MTRPKGLVSTTMILCNLAGTALCSAAGPDAATAGRPVAAAPPPVIDMHLHVPRPTDVATWQAELEALNVQAAILIGIPDQLKATTMSDPARFLPSLMFPCENGGATNTGARCFEDGSTFPPIDLVRRMVSDGRLKALGEVNAQYLGIPPNDPRMEPYYALAEELDIPIGVHLGIAAPGVAYPGPGFPPTKSPHYSGAAGSPLLLEPVLVKHPKMRLYVAHAAWPFLADLTYMLYMHPQLYADVSVLQWAIPRPAYYSYLKSLVDAGFAKRLMFGSDGGARHLRMGVEAILNAEFLTPEEKADILYNNAARFLRLHPASPPARP